jgi:predicted acylesterase/phospholipase RssA
MPNPDGDQQHNAIVLSGGGTKGSFEVGALLALREIWNEVRPCIVCGTSVGAINALALAESLDGSGINKLQTIWLGLQRPSDMYRLSPELQQIANQTGINFADVILHGASFPFGSVTDLLAFIAGIGLDAGTAVWAGVGWVVGGPVGGLIGGVVSLYNNDSDKVQKVVDAIKRAFYAYDLAPTQALIENSVRPDLVARSGMQLRLALLTPALTSQSRILRCPLSSGSGDDPATLQYPGFIRDPLLAGTMASAAFPGIFQLRPIFTARGMQYYMDGGARQVLPSQAAIDLGADLILSVAASPTGAGTYHSAPPPQYPATILPIAQRAISLQGDELTIAIETPRGGFPDRDRVLRPLIHPAFEVHDTVVIDPGLIRINMAYGYFRAFDVDQLRRGAINYLQYSLWAAWTDDLIGTRLLCHQIEAGARITSPSDLAGEFAGHVVHLAQNSVFNHDVLQLLRNAKNHIAELIVTRFQTFGAAAFPCTLPQADVGDQSVMDWARTWEKHVPSDWNNFLKPVNLWSPQPIDSHGGRETDVVQPSPIPDGIVSALGAKRCGGQRPYFNAFGRNAAGELIWCPQPGWAVRNLTQYATIGAGFQVAGNLAADSFLSGDTPTEHVFGRNAAGDLIHYYWTPQSRWAAENLTQRAATGAAFRIASDPTVDSFLSGDTPTEHVFGRNAAGDLIQYYWSPQTSWAAENLTQRATIGNAYRIVGNPTADSFLSGDTPTEHVFGRNAAGDLIQYYWSPQPSWAAENLTQRANIGNAYRIAGDPAADSFLSGDTPTEHVFGRNADGDLIHYYWSPRPSWAAENLTQRATIGNAYRIAGAPVAVSFLNGNVPEEHVFGRNAAGNLIHYYWTPQASWAAENLTQRAATGAAFQIAGDPAADSFRMAPIRAAL